MRVKVSSEFQVVIPREIRKVFSIKPGDSFEIIPHDNRIELVPARDIRTMRGFLKGIDTTVEREGDRL